MPDTKLTLPSTPITTDAAAPPADTLRTAHRDWLLVGYLDVSPSEEGPDDDVYCAEQADLATFVARFWARHDADARGPDLWLAPRLRERFVTRAVETDTKGRLAWALSPALQLAQVSFGPRGELRFVDGHPPTDAEHEAFGREDGSSYFGQDLIEYGLPLDGRAADLAHLVAQARAAQLLYKPRATAGGYIYVVTAHDRARRERRGEPYLRPLDEWLGWLRPAKNAGALPEPAAELLAYVRRYHRDKAPDCGSGNLPSDSAVVAWLEQRGFEDPEPTPPPDAKLAGRVETLIVNFHNDKGRGPTQKQVVNKLGKRGAAVRDVLAWLIRQGRVTLGPKGPHGEHEYLPAD